MILAGWHAAQWTAFGTLAYAATALAAAVFVGVQVLQARDTRADRSRPFVMVDIRPAPMANSLLELVVENIGPTLARNVRVRFDPPLTSAAVPTIANAMIVTGTIASLPPGRRMTAFFDSAISRDRSEHASTYEVTVAYDDARGKHQDPLEYTIDLSPLYDLRFLSEKRMNDLVKEVEAIRKHIDGMVSSEGLRVHASDADRADRDIDAKMAILGRYPSLSDPEPPELLMSLGRNVVGRIIIEAVRRWRDSRNPSAPPH